MPRLPLVFLLLAAPVWAQPVKTNWRVAGVVPEPVREVALTLEAPAGVSAIQGVSARYGVLALAGRRVGVAVNPDRVWIDRDRNGSRRTTYATPHP